MRRSLLNRILIAAPFALPGAVAFHATTPVSAQATLSSLSGRVLDPTGAAIPAVHISVRNTDVGSVRTLTCTRDGSFRVDGLLPGAYMVEARGAGLSTRPSLRLTITLGSSREIVLQLRPESVKQSALVTGRGASVEGNTVAPPVNTAEASVSSFLPGLTVTYLPNRARDLQQFTALAAGAQEEDDSSGVVLNGQRPSSLGILIDGTNFASPLLGGFRGASDRELFLPLTAVREFEIVRTGVDAPTGGTSSGLINIATKGGANRPRGEAFYTGRPTQFAAADAFGRPLQNTQNAFGASYGGPLRRDRSFYLLSFEQELSDTPFYTAFDPQPLNTVIPAALLTQQRQIVGHQSPTAGFGRLDFNLTPASTLSLELGLNRIRSSNLDNGLSRSMGTLSHASSLSGQSLTSRAGLTTNVSSRLFNSVVAAWSSDHRNTTPNSTAPEQFINGFGILGGDSAGQHLYTSQRTQILDDATLSRGRNALAFGGAVAVEPAYEQQEFNTNGRFDYNSLANLLSNTPRRFQQTLVTGDARFRGTVTHLGFYASTRIALRPNLFLTVGLRWDAQFNPQPTHPNQTLPNLTRIPNDLLQFQPRLGLAWSPDSKTVLRVSSGLYSAATPATFFHHPATDNGSQTVTLDSYFDPTLLTLTGANTATPHALAAGPPGLSIPHALVVGFDPAFRNPMTFQLAASADRQLAAKLELTAGYLRSSSWNLERRVDENLAAPTLSANGTPLFLSPRPIAGMGRFLVEQSTAHSSYDAGFVSLNAPLSRRSQLLVNYTLGRTRDDDSNSGPNSPDSAVNPFNLQAERGFSSFDIRNSLNLNAIFDLPVGFKLNPLFTTHSGLPYTPVMGFDTQGDANDLNDRAILNGLIAPRNALRQPLFSALDLRLVKDFTLKGEGHHLDLFMDVFNLIGSGNRRFGSSGLDFFGTAASPVFSAGQPLYAPGVGKPGGSRAIQFTARLVGF